MNTNGRPSSLGAPGPRTVYAGTDSSAQIMQVVASNSMIPLGLYQNVDKDQLDWGALAQQWIQMREQWSQPAEDFIPSPPPPPSFSPTRELYAPSNSFDSPETMHPYSAVQASNMASSPSKFEEQGEAPMEVEKEEEAPATSQLMLPVPAPQQTIVNPNATAAVASWQAKINQLYQIEPTQVRPGLAAAPVHQRGSGRAGRSIETESKPSLLMDRELKLAGSGTGEPVPPVTLNGVMKDSYSGGSITMNEAKRKLLPAWIREGLEKMERDKQRQFEREQERKLWEEQQRRQRCVEDATHETWNPVKHGASPAHDHTSKPEDEVDLSAASPTPTPMSENAEDGSENADDNFEEVAIAVRTALTEILLDVTGSMINTIAEETLGKINKRKGKQAQSTQVKPGLATCTGGLGLGIYGDSDEDDEEEEEEQQQKQQTAGKGEASGSDSDRDDSTDGDLSDSAVEQRLKDTIRRKQREFEASAREIEQWIDSLQQGGIETNEPKPSNSKQQLFRKLERDAYYSDEDAQDLDVEDEDGSGVSDGRDEANKKQSASTRPAGSSAASVNGDAGANSSVRSGSTRDGETQPVNDKLYASQQFAGRKRREKRVSRFSMLQEPRSRPPPSLNTLGMPVATTYKLGTLAYAELPAIAKTRPGDPSQTLAPDATATRANQTLADPQLLLGVLRSGGNELAAGSQLPTTEQILKRYLLAIQPTSAGTSEGMQRGHELQVAPGETKVKPAGHGRHEVLNAGASSSVSSPLPYKEPSERKSAPREAHQQRERSEKGAKIADAGQHRAQHRGRDAHRHRSRSKSSRSYTRSPHSVSGSTRSRSSRSRSRSAHRERAGHSSSRHRHRSERSRHRGSRRRSRSHSRSRSDSRSRTRSRSRSRSSGRSRRSPSSKYFSRRRY